MVTRLLVISTLGVLISADLHVLTLTLLHKLLQDRIILLGDGLGCHLHGAVTAVRLDALCDSHDGILEPLDTSGLVQTLASQDVERRSNELDLDLALGGVLGLGGAEGIFDGIDPVVTEAGNLDIGTDLGRVGSELAADVQLDLALDGVAGECDLIPDGGVSKRRFVRGIQPSRKTKEQNLRDGDFESIVRVTVFLVQRPADGLVEGLEGGLSRLCDMAHDRVHGLALVVTLLTLDHILGGDTALGKIDITFRLAS